MERSMLRVCRENVDNGSRNLTLKYKCFVCDALYRRRILDHFQPDCSWNGCLLLDMALDERPRSPGGGGLFTIVRH